VIQADQRRTTYGEAVIRKYIHDHPFSTFLVKILADTALFFLIQQSPSCIYSNNVTKVYQVSGAPCHPGPGSLSGVRMGW